MEKDPFKEYLRESEPDKAHKGYVWSTAIFPFDRPTYLVQSDSRSSSTWHSEFDILW